MFRDVNVDYKPCKSAIQLQRAADYIIGRQPESIRNGVIKTASDLYLGMNCDCDNFARDVLHMNYSENENLRMLILLIKCQFHFNPTIKTGSTMMRYSGLQRKFCG